MPRYKLTVEYDGRPFSGWQRQANAPSVQAVIERAVKAFSGEEVTIGGAGRTDTGVHATGQVCHVDLSKDWDARTVMGALNFHCQPHPVVILDAAEMHEGFDARFSAIRRSYRYRIQNRLPPLTHQLGLAWHVKVHLDADAMHAAAQEFVGHHDFTTFRHTRCQAKSPEKTLEEFRVYREGEFVIAECASRSFLHNQVRSMVGSLRLVGEGKWGPGDVTRALQARDRNACGPVAPADGLYLTRVDYRSAEMDIELKKDWQARKAVLANGEGEEDGDA
ncbi:tRNA pseudouridine synthase A [Labrenzia sp. THAF191b]|uniref:tRNA pseudouridine(38-40) synthase TruA n=1 Tax=unclassified Labrenzia TaxID=2648686 RepID=UPI00126792F6|nr:MULTISPECIES: tRNA pseudouridine(38-40) synthase TruA [unclassified Labrenzia]QFS96197.1 tRNA pseudouridine synthase A [Labrenzia sp. THAF191b]QFT02512.1 tRNA pseudouridine synthase A [Labrenzia sp. THAF191a]QFT14054.1 tRNA pseudouridine synthase A [Labrenzia sp. THAF187b]